MSIREQIGAGRVCVEGTTADLVRVEGASDLPLTSATRHLFPSGGLRRGTLIDVGGAPGATSVALALLSGPCRSGAWIGFLGLEHLGWAAAVEMGLPLQRTVSVNLPRDREDPGCSRTAVMGAMIDAFDVVVFGAGSLPGGATLRKLRVRARERGSLLVSLRGGVTNADARLDVLATRWEGLGQGWGHLGRRTVEVQVSGRGALDRPWRGEVRFDPDGRPVALDADPLAAGHLPRREIRELVS